MRKAAHLVDDLFQLDTQILEAGVHHPGLPGDGLACAEHLNLQYRQRLPNIIVQFSCNAGAVRLLCIHPSAAQLIARHFGVAQVLLRPLKKSNIFADRSQASGCVRSFVADQ